MADWRSKRGSELQRIEFEKIWREEE